MSFTNVGRYLTEQKRRHAKDSTEWALPTQVLMPQDYFAGVRILAEVQRKIERGENPQLDAPRRHHAWETYKSSCYVYFMACFASGLVKIGKTDHLERRIKSLHTMSPVPLTLLAAPLSHKRTEDALHEMLSEHRSHGEWFFMRGLVLDAIDAAQESSAALTEFALDSLVTICHK